MQSETRLTGDLVAAPPIDAALAEIAARQHGLVTVADLHAAGLDDRAIHKRVARGVLHRKFRGVYSVGHAVLSREGEWLAAVLACGPGAVLSHLSAAELHRLTRKSASLIAVVSPRRRRLEGVKVHTARRLDPRDVTTHRGIPVTTVHRTFVDLTDDPLTPHEIAAFIKEARFLGRWVEPAVRDSMARANGRHHLDVLEQAIDLHNAGSAGTRSANEVLFLRLDLPDSLVNTKLLGFEADFLYPEAKLNVEIDGPQHNTPQAKLDDAHRDRILRAAGYTVLRFPEEVLKERPDEVVRAVLAWVSSRGLRRAA